MLTGAQLGFLSGQRVARLATVDGAGAPQVLPVCYAATADSVYITVDQKPKHGDPKKLKRLQNIRRNPNVALIADHYDDGDWSQLRWLMIRGRAEILDGGAEHGQAQDLLRARYPQYRAMVLDDLPVISIRIESAREWQPRASMAGT
jgi:PPOX class probable F420-dependent enzyme